MPPSPTASDVLDREFLDIRARLLDAAAMLDRIDRAEGSIDDDPRIAQIRKAAAVVADDVPGRPTRILAIFSLPCRDDWREEHGL